MFDIFDIYLLEALINGVLLGGVLALLALGLNLIFGVIDVVWICYAELIMLGMYGMFFLFKIYSVPFLLAAVICIAGVGVLGVVLHLLVIAPLLGAAPINQLLATGGVLFFLQSAATVMFGIDFRNLGIRLPVLEVHDMFISYARLLAFGAALAGMVVLYLFLSRTYTGTAIRAIAQDRQIMPLMGVDARRIYIITSAIGGALAGLAATLLVLQYDVHPFIGLTFGPTTFMICVLGGLGNMVGGFVAAFVFAEIISVSGLYLDLEWGYVFAFGFFIAMMFASPRACWHAGHEPRAALGGGRRADRAAVRLSRTVPDASADRRADLVVDVHLLVGDGPVRPGLARPWRVHGDRRLYHRAAVEQFRAHALARHPRRHAGRRHRRADHRLSLLPLPHHRPLLRAGDAGAERDRAAGDHRDARHHRRFARLHAAALQRRQLDLRAAVHRQGDVVPDRTRRLGHGAVHPLPGRSQHAALRAGGDRRRRGRGGRGGRARDAGRN